MKLLEYQAKQLLAEHAIPTPRSFLVDEKAQPLFLPAVIKSQVPVGGRGKAGGIKIVKTKSDYKKTTTQLQKLSIKGHLPDALLAEELLEIKHEYYLSVLVNKRSAKIQLMAHKQGGIEVEENNKDDFIHIHLTGKNADAAGEQLADYFDLPDKSFVLQDLVEHLYECFTKNDALLLEINPLVLTKSGELVAGDCKMECDDAAHFRHQEWEKNKKASANFVTLHHDGNVATIANGAGLAMATVDAVANAGLKPANFLDVGGGANEASVMNAFQRIMDYPNIKAIVINIFAGITHCDEIAKAIISAKSHFADLPPVSIRLAGTNFEQAAELLSEHSIPTLQTLEECVSNAKDAAA